MYYNVPYNYSNPLFKEIEKIISSLDSLLPTTLLILSICSNTKSAHLSPYYYSAN